MLFEVFVDFYVVFYFVLGFVFFLGQFDVVYVVIVQVDQVQVIDEVVKEVGFVSCIWIYLVILQGEELFIGMGMLQVCRQEGCGENEGF